jgi:small subunit ribosomal protein S6
MKNRYEALLILDTKGKEDGAKDIIERLEKAFTKEGAAIEQVQRLDKRQFSYAAGDLDHGYYVNFIFTGESTIIDALKNKFRLDEDIYRQHYLRLKSKAAVKAAA